MPETAGKLRKITHARATVPLPADGSARAVPAPPRRVASKSGRVAIHCDQENREGRASVRPGLQPSGRLTRSAQRHGDTESEFETGLCTVSFDISSTTSTRHVPTPSSHRPSTQCTRAALGAWRSTAGGSQFIVTERTQVGRTPTRPGLRPSGRLTRSTRRHGDTESILRLAYARLHSPPRPSHPPTARYVVSPPPDGLARDVPAPPSARGAQQVSRERRAPARSSSNDRTLRVQRVRVRRSDRPTAPRAGGGAGTLRAGAVVRMLSCGVSKREGRNLLRPRPRTCGTGRGHVEQVTVATSCAPPGHGARSDAPYRTAVDVTAEDVAVSRRTVSIRSGGSPVRCASAAA